MIKTENLTKRFGAKTVVDDVSFRVEPGTVTGFLGANGAGKTTTLRLLTGLSEPDGGRRSCWAALPRPAQSGTPRRRPARCGRAARRRRGREALAISAQLMGVDQRRVQRATRPGRPRPVGGQEAGAPLLPGHASAARHRPCTARGSRGADPRRARERARSSRDPLDARAAARLRRPRRHRPRFRHTFCTRCRRSPTGRDHRPRPHRRAGEPRRLLAGSGTLVRGDDDVGFVRRRRPPVCKPAPQSTAGSSSRSARLVGRAALAGGVALSRLAGRRLRPGATVLRPDRGRPRTAPAPTEWRSPDEHRRPGIAPVES